MKLRLTILWFTATLWVAFLQPGVAPSAHARAPASELHAGDRVRLAAPPMMGQPGSGISPTATSDSLAPLLFLVGTLTRVDADTIAIQPDSSQTSLAVPVAAIERLEVWKIHNSKTAGGTIGFVAGAVVGGLVGHSMEDSGSTQPCGEEEVICLNGLNVNPLSDTAVGVIIGGLLGGSVGALVGMCMESGRWEPADMHRPQVGIRMTRQGEVLLYCSVRF